MEDFDENDEIINALADKFLKNKPKDNKTAKKLMNHLFSKGYSFDKINKVVKNKFYNFESLNEGE